MTHSIALITDSTSNLPASLLDKYDIYQVPVHLIRGVEDLRDRLDIQPEDSYRRLTNDPIHPTTSQPSPKEFLNTINRTKDREGEEAVIFTIGSGMSVTYQSRYGLRKWPVFRFMSWIHGQTPFRYGFFTNLG